MKDVGDRFVHLNLYGLYLAMLARGMVVAALGPSCGLDRPSMQR